MTYKYIFCAGAPGSKWSSLIKNIYYSPDVDRSDYSDARTYYHDASGKMDLMHLGAYFDPGMEFDLPEDLNNYNREQLEALFDRPFTGTGVRIIKSHIFANHIDHIKKLFSECPMILALRDDDACLGWWVRCGHFNITYPKYDKYYVDLKRMGFLIMRQNIGIMDAWLERTGNIPTNNHELAEMLGIKPPPEEYFQDYKQADVGVKVI